MAHQEDRQDQALQVLARVHSKGDTNNAYVKAELVEIVAKLEWEKRNPPMTYLTMLFGSEARRTWLAIGVVRMELCTDLSEDSANATVNSKSGNNLQVSTCRFQFYSNAVYRMLTRTSILYYAVFLFQQAGLSDTSASLLANGLQGVVLNVFTLPDMFYMDKWGRRIPMIIGGFAMGICMMLIAVIMKTKGISLRLPFYVGPTLTILIIGDPVYNPVTKKTNFNFADKHASNAAIAFVYIYVMSLALSWACVAWVYPPELFSTSMRGRGTSLSSASNWFVVSIFLVFSYTLYTARLVLTETPRISGSLPISQLPWTRSRKTPLAWRSHK
jgi:hypothetical protein